MKPIQIRKARIHNLQNIDLDIPKGLLVVITGVSGSGKSSLAFDLLFAEGHRRYLQAVSGKGFYESTGFDDIYGLSPTIAVEQRTIRQSNPRSSVGTRTKIIKMLQILYSLAGMYPCSYCGETTDVNLNCSRCGGQEERMSPACFSPNAGEGMCLKCFGRGWVLNRPEDEVLHQRLSGPESIWRKTPRLLKPSLQKLAAVYGFDVGKPFGSMSEAAKKAYLHGDPVVGFEGCFPFGQRVSRDKKNQSQRIVCPACQGYQIGEEARSITIGGFHIGHLARMTIAQLTVFMEDYYLIGGHSEIKPVVAHIVERLGCLTDVGLAHLSLDRTTPTLSGGELQRLFLASYLNADLDSLIYIFDEPTVGLHEIEKGRLLHRLRQLQKQGNSVIVVEHDPTVISQADHVIEIGPGAGKFGGRVVYEGNYAGYLACEQSVIAKLLSGKSTIQGKPKTSLLPPTEKLVLSGAQAHNLKHITVEFPLGLLVGIAGVSGSGKSTLVAETLVPLLEKYIEVSEDEQKSETEEDEKQAPLPLDEELLTGWEPIHHVSVVTQAPIGRNKTSTPASYLGIWDKIRALFAKQEAAVQHALTIGDFSFNSTGGCQACSGEGIVTTSVGDYKYSQTCSSCSGTRYRAEVLQVAYHGKTVHEVLEMTVTEAEVFFSEVPMVVSMLKTVDRVGMGYMTLGQPSSTVSGGEAQRIKLAKELGRNIASRTLYILDEPTTGLSCADAEKLMTLLDGLVQQGNSVLVIEHDPTLLSFCDWIIELGPWGGEAGGEVIAQGTPQELLKNPGSKIGSFLHGGGTNRGKQS